MHSQSNEFHAMAPVWEPCGPGCACNDLTMICRGPITLDVEPLPMPAFDCGVPHIVGDREFPRWPIPSLYPGVEHGPLTALGTACQDRTHAR